MAVGILSAQVVQREDITEKHDNGKTRQRVLVRIFEQKENHAVGDQKAEHKDVCEGSIVTTSNIVAGWLKAGATLLQNQWPRSPSPSSSLTRDNHSDIAKAYLQSIIHHDQSTTYYGLACSYIFLSIESHHHQFRDHTMKDDDSYSIIDDEESRLLFSTAVVIGHGRLTECFESAGGNAAAATYIVVDPGYRGCGHGKCLMSLLEHEAKRLGYHYVYLWTRTAVNFYINACGYSLCHRVSLKRACLQSLAVEDVQGIEAMLMRRQQTHNQQQQEDDKLNQSRIMKSMKQAETVMLLPPGNDSNVQEDDKWLRKRLVEHVGSMNISTDERLQQIQSFVKEKNETDWRCSVNAFVRWNTHVPHSRQIGPSCGLAALRMVRDYYNSRVETTASGEVEGKEGTSITVQNTIGNLSTSDSSHDRYPSLLSEAISRGYTHDGEIFDANSLYRLAIDVCDIPPDSIDMASCCTQETNTSLATRTTSLPSLLLSQLDLCLRRGGVAILPYDSNPRTRLPSKLRGTCAHWGIVVGIIYFQNIDQEANHDKSLVVLSDTDDIVLSRISEGNHPGELFEVHLCVQHSLSAQWAIAPMQEWIDSNMQLISVDNTKFNVDKGGLNLKNKIILIQK